MGRAALLCPLFRGRWPAPAGLEVMAACGGGLCRRVVFADAQGEGIAFGDEFYMPLTRPPSTAIAVPLPHRWERQVRYGICACVTSAA